jgi:hypothetical protein
MSEINLSDKIAESITTVIKKTKTYEKTLFIGNIMIGVGIFCIINTVFSSFNYLSLNHIISNKYNFFYHIKKELNFIHNKLNTLNKILDKIVENNAILEIPSNKMHISTSMSDFDEYLKNNEVEVKEYDNILENNILEDDELLNECYDVLPCNNTKKVIGMKNIFAW